MITVDGKEYSVEAIMNVKDKPKMFYKYHTINENLNKLISNARFHMQSHLYQNDFLDCKFDLSPEYLERTIREEIEAMLNEKGLNLSIDGIYNQMMSIQGWRGMQLLQTFIASPLYLTCFTANANVEHMWALYGDGHKGIRLAFDFSDDPELLEHILPVHYTDKIPIVQDEESLVTIPYFKRKFFEVEDEWRLCIGKSAKLPFKKSSLKEIQFGCRVSEKEQDKIKLLLRDSGYDVYSMKGNQMRVSINNIDIPFHLMDELIAVYTKIKSAESSEVSV